MKSKIFLILFLLAFIIPFRVQAASIWQDGTLLKTTDIPKVYIVYNNIKRWLKSPTIFNSYGLKWSAVKTVKKDTLDLIPEAILIRQYNQPEVYLLENNQKRWIVGPKIFEESGFSWQDIQLVNPLELDKYQTGNPIAEKITKKPEEKKIKPEEVVKPQPTPTPIATPTTDSLRVKNERTQEMLDWAKERKIFFVGVNNNLLIPSSKFATDIIPMIEVPNTQKLLPSLQKLPDHLIRLLENNTIVVSTKFTWEKCKTHGLNDGFFLCQHPDGYFVHEIGHRVDFYGIKTFALGKTDEENKTISEEYERIFSIPEDLYAKPSIFPGLPAGFLTSYSKSNIFENFADHFGRYVESPELFRERAAKDPGLAEKYEFLKTKIFLGKEYGKIYSLNNG